MRILVQKFGGTSVADLECMKQVRGKVVAALEQGYKLVVVLSARSGHTDSLYALAMQHSSMPDGAEEDTLVSVGEQISASLFAMMLRDVGIKARSMLGWQVPILTDARHSAAHILSVDDANLRYALETYDVVVMAGFQGVTDEGRITTLGRGGSDTTALAVAAALGSVECEIYTDVDGIYTTDPRLCPAARKLDRVCYEEMLEMSSLGSKVLQIRSMEFAKKYKVPVHVRSTFSDLSGTMIVQGDSMLLTDKVLVSSIAYDRDQACVTLLSVPEQQGVVASVFSSLAQAGVSVDMIVLAHHQGTADLTFTVSRKELKRTLPIVEDVCKAVGGLGVECTENVAKVSAIGVGMRDHSGVASRLFSSLSAENIDIFGVSTSEIKISCLIEEKHLELAVNTLHQAFGLDKCPLSGE